MTFSNSWRVLCVHGGRTSLHLCQESSSLSSLDSKERSQREEPGWGGCPALGMALGDSGHKWLIQVQRKLPLRVTASIEFLLRILLGPVSQSVVHRPPVADVKVEVGTVKKPGAWVGQVNLRLMQVDVWEKPTQCCKNNDPSVKNEWDFLKRLVLGCLCRSAESQFLKESPRNLFFQKLPQVDQHGEI